MENIIVLIIAIVIAAIWYAINENKKSKRAQSNTHIANKQAQQHTPKVEVQELKFFCVKDKGYHVSVWPNVQGYQGLDYIEFQIAGISHYKSTAMKHIGESLAILAEEPDNPYDPNAIRIMTSDWQLLGYVPRDMTDEIRRHTSLSCPCFIYIGYRPDEDTFFTDAYNYPNPNPTKNEQQNFQPVSPHFRMRHHFQALEPFLITPSGSHIRSHIMQ